MTSTDTISAVPAPAAAKPLRADAARNRQRLLEVAAAAFAERGAEIPLEDVAAAAGVGIGTLYRNFATREELVGAVYQYEVDVLCARADELLSELPPAEALAAWMRLFVIHVRTKRGMMSVLKPMLTSESPLVAGARGRAIDCASRLLAAGVEAGTVRNDLDGADLIRAVSGICMTTDQEAISAGERLVGVIVDGLRVVTTTPAS